MSDRLSRRELNRATLARQLLLARSEMPVLRAVEHLVGMQAQVPHNPYTGLWSRLDAFDPGELSQLLIDRKVVRIVVMRGTLHLVTADDCLVLRPLAQPVLDRELERHSEYGPLLRGLDLAPITAFAGPLVGERPRTGPELRKALAARFPDQNAAALAYACRNKLAFVQVPPRGVWGRSAQVCSTTAEAWLGKPLAEKPSIDDVVLRYFAAFGPASVADVSAWSRLTGMREVVDRLGSRLRAFKDESGRELLDLPDASRPAPDVPAPARFLPEYDNVLLSHSDRSRFSADGDHQPIVASGPVRGTVLHDGTVSGTWRTERDKRDNAALVVDHLGGLSKAAQNAIADEGRRLVAFLVADADAYDVRLVNPY
jgi:hypothetical protein